MRLRVRARACVREYFAELARRFESGFDDTGAADDGDAFRPPSGVMVDPTWRSPIRPATVATASRPSDNDLRVTGGRVRVSDSRVRVEWRACNNARG